MTSLVIEGEIFFTLNKKVFVTYSHYIQPLLTTFLWITFVLVQVKSPGGGYRGGKKYDGVQPLAFMDSGKKGGNQRKLADTSGI